MRKQTNSLAMIEQLDSRRLYTATGSVSGGTLTITSDAASDNVTLKYDSTISKYSVIDNASGHRVTISGTSDNYTPATAIVFNGNDGDDVFTTDSTVTLAVPMTLNGDAGRDKLTSGPGADQVNGGDSIDTLSSAAGNDTVTGGGGGDTIDAGANSDYIYGGSGNDFLYGGSGSGNDVIYGDSGDDYISGQAGNDTIYGGDGADTLYGDAGADSLYDYVAGSHDGYADEIHYVAADGDSAYYGGPDVLA